MKIKKKIIIATSILLIIASGVWVCRKLNRNYIPIVIEKEEEVVIEKAVMDSVFVLEVDTIVPPLLPAVRRVREEEEVFFLPPPPPPPVIEIPHVQLSNGGGWVTEWQARFPGNLHQWLHNNLRYPRRASTRGIQGNVLIQFVVDIDGSVVDIKVLSGDPHLASEAVQIISKMPKWYPAVQYLQPVRQRFALPIRFVLIYDCD